MSQFLKWAGGKSKLLNIMFDNFPTVIHNYHEPFLGGGSVLFEILRKIHICDIKITGELYVSDINESLIYCYINIKLYPDLLYIELNNLYEEYYNCKTLKNEVKTTNVDTENYMISKENYYYYIRGIYNNIDNFTTLKSSAMFIFLNKTCFRGLHRIGSNGFNVAFGHYERISTLTKDKIYEIHRIIQNVNFSHQDFETALSNVGNSDFIYMDPPYVKQQKTSFVSYNLDGYNKHKILFNICSLFNKKKLDLCYQILIMYMLKSVLMNQILQ
jgi:DNA adenine methylase